MLVRTMVPELRLKTQLTSWGAHPVYVCGAIWAGTVLAGTWTHIAWNSPVTNVLAAPNAVTAAEQGNTRLLKGR